MSRDQGARSSESLGFMLSAEMKAEPTSVISSVQPNHARILANREFIPRQVLAARTWRGMNSLFAKILAWFGCTLLITLVGSAFISALSMNPNDSDERAPWSRLIRFQLEEARTAYETGGRPEL